MVHEVQQHVKHSPVGSKVLTKELKSTYRPSQMTASVYNYLHALQGPESTCYVVNLSSIEQDTDNVSQLRNTARVGGHDHTRRRLVLSQHRHFNRTPVQETV